MSQSKSNINYYKTLEINENASKKNITDAYRKLARKWHPDKNLGNEELAKKEFQKVKEAYEVLSDEVKRKEYDLKKENGMGINWDNIGRSMFGESVKRLKEFFVFYGANENDLDPQLWTPFANWEDKAWDLWEKNDDNHRDFLEMLREASQKAGEKKKSIPAVENTSQLKVSLDKEKSENPQIPYREEKSLKESPKNSAEKGETNKIELVKDDKNNDNKSSSNNQNEPINNDEKLVINLWDIKQITLTSDGSLVIEFNKSGKTTFATQTILSEQIIHNQELQKAKGYLQKEGKTSISQQEFNKLISSNSTVANSTKKPENSYVLLIVGGIGILVIGVLATFFTIRNKKKKRL